MVRAWLGVWAAIFWHSACASEPVRPRAVPAANRSDPARASSAPALDARSADIPTPNRNAGPETIEQTPNAVKLPWSREDEGSHVPYQATFEAAQGGELIGGYAPRTFRGLVVEPGAAHVFRAYSDRIRPPRGVEVDWEGRETLVVEVLDREGQPIRFRDRIRASGRRVELLSKDVPNYFFVRIANPGNEPVTYDAVLHVWLAADP